MVKRKRIESFNFSEGLIFQNKFKIGQKTWWEAGSLEVYRVYELMTGIERAAKFFFPILEIKRQIPYAKAHV